MTKNQTLLVIALGLAALGGCKKNEKVDPPATSSVTTKVGPPKATPKSGSSLAQIYLDCTGMLNAGKLEDFSKTCITDNFVLHDAGAPDLSGSAAMLEQNTGYRIAFPDLKIQPQLVIIHGRNVLATSLLTGTHTGPMKGPMGEVPATNKNFGFLIFHRVVMNDENMATEEWAYFDPGTLMAQLGLTPKDAPPARPVMDKSMDGAPVIVVAADDDKEKRNLDAFDASYTSFTANRVSEMMAMWADDAIAADQAESGDHKGKAAIQATTEMWFKAFPDHKTTELTKFAAGDYVAIAGMFEATNTGAMGPMKATGKKVTAQFAEVMQLKDGKIVKVWRFRNGMDLAMQLARP